MRASRSRANTSAAVSRRQRRCCLSRGATAELSMSLASDPLSLLSPELPETLEPLPRLSPLSEHTSLSLSVASLASPPKGCRFDVAVLWGFTRGQIPSTTQQSLLAWLVVICCSLLCGFLKTLAGYVRGHILVKNNIPIIRKLRQDNNSRAAASDIAG